ncbi:MAG: hypothetical protein P8Z00_20510 [Anaerolineales bacterium]|jgi:uncharacterized OsmC-like protein
MANEDNKYIVVNHAHGKMASRTAAEIYIRDFPVLISDEPPSRGGENQGPTPLELILAALCA